MVKLYTQHFSSWLDDYEQVKIAESLFSTIACVAAPTSAFVEALKTLTVAKHPSLMTVDSAGRRFVPQVVTSIALLSAAMRVRTYLKADGVVHLVADGKLTLRLMPGGRMGAPLARRTWLKFTTSDE